MTAKRIPNWQLNPRGVTYSFTLIVSFHPVRCLLTLTVILTVILNIIFAQVFVTSTDKGFNVRCFFLESVKNIDTAIDVKLVYVTSFFELSIFEINYFPLLLTFLNFIENFKFHINDWQIIWLADKWQQNLWRKSLVCQRVCIHSSKVSVTVTESNVTVSSPHRQSIWISAQVRPGRWRCRARLAVRQQSDAFNTTCSYVTQKVTWH